MKVVLELQDQPSNIKRVTVRHDIVIGRGADCNLRLSSPQVSRRHCFLRISSDAVTVTDLDSSNGTFLSGQRLPSGKRFPIADGTKLAVGPISFIARVESEAVPEDLLEVNVNDDRIEAEAAAAPEEVGSEGPAGADMNFSIESAGPAAEEDEPTTDYSASDDLSNSNYFSDSEDEPATVSVNDRGHADGVPSIEQENTPDPAGGSADELIIEAERVEPGDDEPVVELSENDLVIDVEDEVLELTEDELLADDEPRSDDKSGTPSTDDIDQDEEELRSFLQGLE